MVWTIEYTDTAKHQLKKLDKQIARRILDYMDERIIGSGNPHGAGKLLMGMLGGLWRYCVEDYRVICDIQNKNLRILVLKLGNRREVYREKH